MSLTDYESFYSLWMEVRKDTTVSFPYLEPTFFFNCCCYSSDEIAKRSCYDWGFICCYYGNEHDCLMWTCAQQIQNVLQVIEKNEENRDRMLVIINSLLCHAYSYVYNCSIGNV